MREESEKLRDEQYKFKEFATLHLSNIAQQTDSQSNDTVRLLEYDHQIVHRIDTAGNFASRGHETLTSDLAEQSRLIRRGNKHLYSQGARLLQTSHRTRDTMRQLQSETHKNIKGAEQSLDRLRESVDELRSKATFPAVTIDTATRILREELRVTLREVLDQEMMRSQTQFETKLQEMETTVNQISLNLGHDWSKKSKDEAFDGSLHTMPTNQQILHHGREQFEFAGPRDFTNSVMDVSAQDTSIKSSMVTSTYRRTWHKRWKSELFLSRSLILHTAKMEPHPQSRILWFKLLSGLLSLCLNFLGCQLCIAQHQQGKATIKLPQWWLFFLWFTTWAGSCQS